MPKLMAAGDRLLGGADRTATWRTTFLDKTSPESTRMQLSQPRANAVADCVLVEMEAEKLEII
jgi:outer membrane protein OmpA-like peptidoglycan-associated protein